MTHDIPDGHPCDEGALRGYVLNLTHHQTAQSYLKREYASDFNKK